VDISARSVDDSTVLRGHGLWTLVHGAFTTARSFEGTGCGHSCTERGRQHSPSVARAVDGSAVLRGSPQVLLQRPTPVGVVVRQDVVDLLSMIVEHVAYVRAEDAAQPLFTHALSNISVETRFSESTSVSSARIRSLHVIYVHEAISKCRRYFISFYFPENHTFTAITNSSDSY